jgi:hypothetical protein
MNRGVLSLFLLPVAGLAQIDQRRAAEFFNEAKALCEREGGKLWKTSLCGPIVFADPATKTIATNQPAPEGARPAVLGFANTAIDWGGARWTTISWPFLAAMRDGQGQVMIHELFHRIQPQLGLFVPDLPNDHLDTPDGRYWMQLEWKALSRALGSSGETRLAAARDALAFRAARRAGSPAQRRASGHWKSTKVLRSTRPRWWPPVPARRRRAMPSSSSQKLPRSPHLFVNSLIPWVPPTESCSMNTRRVGRTGSNPPTIWES